MTVRVRDDGKPVRSAEASVTITVKRNRYLPTFSESKYEQPVSENTDNQTVILRVTARDRDLQGEINYELVGVAPAPSYFSVGRTNGNIYVIKDLKLDRALTYTVGTSTVCVCVLVCLLCKTVLLHNYCTCERGVCHYMYC